MAVGTTTALETLLRRDRLMVSMGLAAAVALAWLYITPMALDMYGTMNGPAQWMMTATWDAHYLLLTFLMWTAMMLGMMLPSAAPTLLLYAALLRGSSAATSTTLRPVSQVYACSVGYLLAWTGFSLLATGLQWALSRLALLSPMLISASPLLGGSILIAAGIYQWTPLKRACLDACRNPAGFLAGHWRPGTRGALRIGWEHGLYCVGCCWVLMLLLFFGGVMNLAWIAAISLFVLLEKLMPFGAQGGRLSGLGLLAAGLFVVLAR
ncbi:MAG: hypothetical protein JWR16_1631 [Nevskia sp.]|nr:hypothetical protein [Nevskia sp.]